jgi:hypothetical protein
LPRLGYYNTPIAISPNANQEQAVSQENKSLKHTIKEICTRRENKLHAMHKSELVELEMHGEREGRCYWRAHESVVKNMHSMATSDKKSNMLVEKSVEKFKAFQEHMACQRRRLEVLQEKARASEKLRIKEFVKMVQSGELEENFDLSRIPLPHSGFVFEKFDWGCVENVMNCGGVSSSQTDILEKIDHGQSTVGNLPSAVTGPSLNMVCT